MSSRSADWHLLYGLLALQNGLISHEQLVSAFAKWTSDKSKVLDELLVSDGAIHQEMRDTLQRMVEFHVQQHSGDVQQSLFSLGGCDLATAREHLEQLDDAELHKSMSAIPDADPFATLSPSVGEPTSTSGRFRILRPLPGALGGMGVISVAMDEELGRQVALKQILSDKADHSVYRQKFHVEAEITGNLEHPGIVPVYSLGLGPDGRPYYAMRLVHGDNLSVTIKKFHGGDVDGRLAGQRRPVDYNSVEFYGLIDRLIDVAQAVRYAHSRGVLHRDLKPDNILVGEYGETLVIDWGLARLPQTSDDKPETSQERGGVDGKAPLLIRSGSHVDATMQGHSLGTVGYAPPEQLNGRVDLITERSDVYALGAILYQILVGKPPINNQDKRAKLDDLILQTISGQITPPRSLHGSVPKSLSAICMKALEREPSERYSSVAAFVQDMERWKADQPVSAAPDSMADRVLRIARRYRTVALTAAAALVGITLVAGIALALVNRARVNEAAARGEAESLAAEKTQLAERNQTVVDTFVAAFLSADLENEGVTSKMTALEVLEQALAQIESNEELESDELTKATLLDAISISLSSLGAYSQAIAAEEEIFRLRRAKLGPTHHDTLTSMTNLAVDYRAAGRLDEALPLLEETLQLMTEHLGPEHSETLTAMHNLATGYKAVGRLEEAVTLFEEALRLETATLGPEHPKTLFAMSSLAGGYMETGRWDEALPLLEDTLRIRKATLGAEHPQTLQSMNNLADTYRKVGRLDESLPLLKETLRLRTNKLGPEHPATITSLNNLAAGYEATGQTEKALPLKEKTLRLMTATLGPEHPNTLTSMNNLAESYRLVGRMDEALRLMKESLRLRTAKLGPEHPSTIASMNNLAMVYRSAGRLEEALPLLQETHRLITAVLGPEHPNTLTISHNLAACYKKAGQLEEALPLFEETFQLMKAVLGPEHPSTLRITYNLAACYRQAGRLEDALPLYQEARRLRRTTQPGPDYPSTVTAMADLQAILSQLHKFGNAREIIEQWITTIEQAETPDLTQLARARTSLAEALVGLERHDEASTHIDMALDMAEIEEIERLRATSIRGAICAAKENWNQAEPLLTESAEALTARLADLKTHKRWYVPWACERVIAMYEAWDKPEEVDRWKTQLAEVNTQIERLRNTKVKDNPQSSNATKHEP